MTRRFLTLAIAVALVVCFTFGFAETKVAHAATISGERFASNVYEISRGSFAGSFAPPQLYGGSSHRGSPITLDLATATAGILGPPDGIFVSLPGGPGVTGTAFKGAYVEVGFGTNFGANTLLKLYEVGDDRERAQLFLWTDNQGNIQPTVTTNPTGVVTLDLRDYASVLVSMRATTFTKVGIGGRDLLGESQGFDLDAVSITPIPEPSSSLLVSSLVTIIWASAMRWRRLAPCTPDFCGWPSP